jgi:general secretion pathway protein J
MAGFTLLEALIATALMGLILATLATITAQWLPNWNRGLVRVQSDENVSFALARLTDDLAAAEFIPPTSETHKPYFVGKNRSVTLVRTAIGPNSGPGLEIVHIAEVRGEQGLILVRTRAPFEPGAQPNFADPVVLLRAPYRLTFSYAGPDTVWQEAWQEQILLPQAIKLTLRDAATQRTLSISTATLVHVGLPIDCLAAKSLDECIKTSLQPSQSSGIANSRS